jgi:hypothetical protein
MLVLLFVFLGTTGVLIPEAAGADNNVRCFYSHTAMDDPIVYPSQPGAAHSHDFFGNRSTNAFSTYASLRAGKSSCPKLPGDLSAYWIPSMYIGNTKVTPDSIVAYYYKPTSGPIRDYPDGWKVIAGDQHATGPQSPRYIYWGCGSGSGIGKLAAPPNCSGRGSVFVHIKFPYCIGSGAPTYGNPGCGSKRMVPQLVLSVDVGIRNGTGLRLASGPAYTMHADYFSVWKPGALRTLVPGL